MALYVVARRLSGGSATAQLRYATCWRFYSTSFREEKDTFGPILVPSDKFVVLSFSFYSFPSLMLLIAEDFP